MAQILKQLLQRHSIKAFREGSVWVVSYDGARYGGSHEGDPVDNFAAILAALGHKGSSQYPFLVDMFGETLLEELVKAASYFTPTDD